MILEDWLLLQNSQKQTKQLLFIWMVIVCLPLWIDGTPGLILLGFHMWQLWCCRLLRLKERRGRVIFHDFVFLLLSASEGQHEAEYNASDQEWESICFFCLFVSLPIVCCYRWFPPFHLVFFFLRFFVIQQDHVSRRGVWKSSFYLCQKKKKKQV